MPEKEERFRLRPDWLDGVPGFSPVEPVLAGLPNLDFPKRADESDEDFYLRRKEAIRDVVENHLAIFKGHKRVKIKLIDEQLRFLTDVFYGYVKKAIVCANRGGGKSLIMAILIWLSSIYQGKSWVDIAGSGDQAKAVYEYTLHFWQAVPRAQDFLAETPLQSLTRLKNGAYVRCIPNSETAARSKHPEGLVCDESCQEDPRKNRTIESALQMPLVHKNFSIVLTSTPHVPVGIFPEIWAQAKERGFEKYFWNCFHAMEACREGLDQATEKDPQALSFCRTQCPLTRQKRRINPITGLEEVRYIGCNGIARTSNGHMPRNNVLEALSLNDIETFLTEHGAQAPRTIGPVYDPEFVDAAYRDANRITRLDLRAKATEEERFLLPIPKMSVGIDWGFRGTLAIIGPVVRRTDDIEKTHDLVVTQERGYTGTGTGPILLYLDELRNKLGKFSIFADSSHPFNNLELEEAGFEIYPVAFSKYKEYGIKNTRKWFESRRLLIDPSCVELRSTLKKYKRGGDGKPIKRDDHFPDALMLSLLHFIYEDEFAVQTEEQEGITVRSF